MKPVEDRGDLWARLMWAAVRVSILVHGHDAVGLGRMLEALRGLPENEWPAWAARLEADPRRAGVGGVAEAAPARDEEERPGQKAPRAGVLGGFPGVSAV